MPSLGSRFCFECWIIDLEVRDEECNFAHEITLDPVQRHVSAAVAVGDVRLIGLAGIRSDALIRLLVLCNALNEIRLCVCGRHALGVGGGELGLANIFRHHLRVGAHHLDPHQLHLDVERLLLLGYVIRHHLSSLQRAVGAVIDGCLAGAAQIREHVAERVSGQIIALLHANRIRRVEEGGGRICALRSTTIDADVKCRTVVADPIEVAA